ncbi:aldehyde dehydrogenase family protein [Inquilinus limosus]|uniref:aldehyde dehydrogenase family protein n=1 Tax=Inquilinus limosus TaxID=171674 RepID=UPI000413E5B2|nr:aldehyde dehydrogenase family protein [Inquilinus limosus]
MTRILKTITPVNGGIYVERPLATPAEAEVALARARTAQAEWRRVPVSERARLLSAAVDAFVAAGPEIAREITWQMGRPVRYTPGEVRGFEERARYMISVAEGALADIDVGPKEGFRRFIRREPLGTVFVVAPWNYPYLTAVNAVVPALMAGNAVILKHSHQTPLCAERFAEALADLPPGVFQHIHADHETTAKMIGSGAVDFVAFTGSVPGGRAVEEAASGRFVGVGLELGGKDPGYVRADADLKHAVETLVDGAFFNSGQSCCGIERIYVHASVYDAFVEGAVELTKQYVLGDPTEEATTLGPMVRASAADFVRGQTEEAVRRGARALIDANGFAADKPGTPYLAPQILTQVDHSMRVMTEESFGPVVGIMKVASDEEAVRLMNDSPYGLTAAVFTRDVDAAIAIGDQVATGTWFLNRCDYLDPALAWTGVKDSGRGCTLSTLGYDYLTRPKSFHLRLPG